MDNFSKEQKYCAQLRSLKYENAGIIKSDFKFYLLEMANCEETLFTINEKILP